MKKRVIRTLALVLAVIFCLGVTACVSEKPADTTDVITQNETDAQTAQATDSGIPADTTTGEVTDPNAFNAGKVVYKKDVKAETVPAYDDSKIGKAMTSGENGVITVFNADFENGDPNCGGEAVSRDATGTGVYNGMFCAPYSKDKEFGLSGGGWTTWSPSAGAPFTEYKQVQFSSDIRVTTNSGNAWCSTFIGCYVSDYTFKIPDNPGDGLWFSFNPNSDTVTVYGADVGSWPGGIVSIPVTKGSMAGIFKLNIVCTPDYSTYVYITPENGEQFLACFVNFADDRMNIYNSANELVKAPKTTTNSLKGDHFVLFVHGGGAANLDNTQILAASNGKTTETVTVTATPTKGNTLGLDITNKTDLVSICYSVWFDAILGQGTEPVTEFNNITEILAKRQSWGGVNAFHYWAKPAQGYYRSSDKAAIRTNMTMLYDAGVDFIIIDLTNAGDGYLSGAAWNVYIESPMNAMLDEIMVMRAEGLGTPYVVFWCGDSEKGVIYNALYEKYLTVEKWNDCFVYWDSKPLFLTTHTEAAKHPLKDKLTVRGMWGLNNEHSTGHWSFLNINNKGTVCKDKDGNPEQISVAVASQETYMSERSAHGRNHGIFWYNQWKYAFSVHPKIVTLTWWNEWAAQRLNVGGAYKFTDNYNQEYSRDIEPMEGGHGDQYYQWMKQYISAYKSGEPCPVLVDEGYEAQVN